MERNKPTIRILQLCDGWLHDEFDIVSGITFYIEKCYLFIYLVNTCFIFLSLFFDNLLLVETDWTNFVKGVIWYQNITLWWGKSQTVIILELTRIRQREKAVCGVVWCLVISPCPTWCSVQLYTVLCSFSCSLISALLLYCGCSRCLFCRRIKAALTQHPATVLSSNEDHQISELLRRTTHGQNIEFYLKVTQRKACNAWILNTASHN